MVGGYVKEPPHKPKITETITNRKSLLRSEVSTDDSIEEDNFSPKIPEMKIIQRLPKPSVGFDTLKYKDKSLNVVRQF